MPETCKVPWLKINGQDTPCALPSGHYGPHEYTFPRVFTEEQLDVAVSAALADRDRYWMWATHGHSGLYGDDGEMQCGQCRVDYKRDALEIVEAAYQKAKATSEANWVSSGNCAVEVALLNPAAASGRQNEKANKG